MEAENELSNQDQEMKKKKNETWEWIKAIAIAAGLVILIRLFIFAPFIVDGHSMNPNLETGERLIVNKIVYTLRHPKRGEIIVFHAPFEERDYIKRVIALPGETIKVEGDLVYIDGKVYEEEYIKEAIDEARANGGTYNNINFNVTNDGAETGKVPQGELFVMGDNRSGSKDSRYIGTIPYKSIVGRADIIFWPLPNFQFIKHTYEVN